MSLPVKFGRRFSSSKKMLNRGGLKLGISISNEIQQTVDDSWIPQVSSWGSNLTCTVSNLDFPCGFPWFPLVSMALRSYCRLAEGATEFFFSSQDLWVKERRSLVENDEQ